MRTILALALFGLAATGAVAQTHVPTKAEAREAMKKLKAADANKDGKWSKDEWLAGGRKEKGFVKLDTNKDGFVDQAELKAAADAAKAAKAAHK